MTPSEILEPLRNDARSTHHRKEAEREIARLEAILADIKAALNAEAIQPLGGA